MNALYNFAVGPLAWIAFTVCIGGMIWRLWSLGRLARQRDASALAYMNWKDSLTSIIRWTLPFSTCGWRENPLLTVANFVLHIGILLAGSTRPTTSCGTTISVFPFLPCPTALWTPSP